jgi:AraC family transcriptional regulator, positive regulator of tynA and feaB
MVDDVGRVPVGISLAAPLERVHTFTLRGAEGLAVLASGTDLLTPDPAAFEAELTTVQLGSIAVDALSATVYTAIRSARHVRDDGVDSVYFGLMRAGQGSVAQDRRVYQQQPGGACVLRTTVPYRAYTAPWPESARRSQVILTTIPMSLLPGKAAKIATMTAVALPKTPLVAAAANFLGTVSLGLPQPGSAAASFVEHAIVDLTLAVIAERTAEELPPESAEAGTRVRIRDFVMRRLPDTELGPRRIATEFGISIRYLHRLFESEDTSVSSFIRGERLKKAASELADPTLRHLDLKSIAARSGFGGADQFARAFKSRYGMTPRDYRRADNPNRIGPA